MRFMISLSRSFSLSSQHVRYLKPWKKISFITYVRMNDGNLEDLWRNLFMHCTSPESCKFHSDLLTHCLPFSMFYQNRSQKINHAAQK